MVLVVKRWVAVASLSTLFACGVGAGWAATRFWPGSAPALAALARSERSPGEGPARPRPAPYPGMRYQIAPDDTLSEVSLRAYGTTRRVSDLLAANPGLDPMRIRPGTWIYVPFAAERPIDAPVAVPEKPAR